VESGFGARSELDRWGECMKSHGSLVSVGTSFLALSVLLAGCPVPEADEWPNGDPRPPGGEPIPATGPSGGGGGGEGAGGIGGASSGTGGTGGGASCGNSNAEAGESCDDGNKLDGDGCSSTCQVEACWDCSGGACMPSSLHTPCNNGTQSCDGDGACNECVPADIACNECMNCGGAECDDVKDCASTLCVTGICRSASGSTCVDAVECASNSCFNGICAACTKGGQCKSGSCDSSNGQCLAAIGEPCDGSLDCADGLFCTTINICKGEVFAQCTDHYQCATNRCFSSNCAICLNDTDCEVGKCDKSSGVCLGGELPNEAYCVNADDCASQKCTGFPRRCEPLAP
jgi:hypothetical protein